MDSGLTLAEKLRSDGYRVESFLSDLKDADRTVAVYTEGTHWTVTSILAHFVSAEKAFLKLFMNIQHGGKGVGEDFQIDTFNAEEQVTAEALAWDDLLDDFRRVRTQMIGLVGSFSPQDLERVGRHPYLGETTLREMVKLIYIHNQTHLRDVRRALSPG